MSGMLLALPVTAGTAPWGVSRILAYCTVSPPFGRCLVYPVRTLEDRVPVMVLDHSDISIQHISHKRKYTGCEVWCRCIVPFEMVGSRPYVAVVVVLIALISRLSDTYEYILCLISHYDVLISV